MNPATIALPGHLPIHWNKSELEALAQKHAKAIQENPQYHLVKTYLELKRYQLYFEALLGALEPVAARSMGETGIREFDHGALRLKHLFRVRYDFVSDPVYREIQELLQQTKQALKDRKSELLRLGQEGQEQENPFNGQRFQAHKPLARGADTVVLQQK